MKHRLLCSQKTSLTSQKHKMQSVVDTLEEGLTLDLKHIRRKQSKQDCIIRQLPSKDKQDQLNKLYQQLNCSKHSDDDQQEIFNKLKKRQGYSSTKITRHTNNASRIISQPIRDEVKFRSTSTKLFWYTKSKDRNERSTTASYIKEKQVNRAVPGQIRQAIGTNVKVELKNVALTNAILTQLLPELKTNYRLKVLDLSFNRLGNISVPLLMDIIAYNELAKLSLRWNRITAEGAQLLFVFLANDVHLKDMDLSQNNLHSTSLSFPNTLNKFISANNKLTHLNLQECHINPEHCKIIAKTFNTTNNTIRGMHFKGNGHFHTNSKGFAVSCSPNYEQLPIVLKTKLSLSSKAKMRPKVKDLEDCCWICGEWVEEEFIYTRHLLIDKQTDSQPAYFIHLSCYDYQPIRMTPHPPALPFQLSNTRTKCLWLTQLYSVHVAVPPSSALRYFYTSENTIFLSRLHPITPHHQSINFLVDNCLTGYQENLAQLSLKQKEYRVYLEQINVYREQEQRDNAGQISFKEMDHSKYKTDNSIRKRDEQAYKSSKCISTRDLSIDKDRNNENGGKVIPRNSQMFFTKDIFLQINTFIHKKKQEEDSLAGQLGNSLNIYVHNHFSLFEAHKIGSYLSQCFHPSNCLQMSETVFLLPRSAYSQDHQEFMRFEVKCAPTHHNKVPPIKSDVKLPSLINLQVPKQRPSNSTISRPHPILLPFESLTNLCTHQPEPILEEIVLYQHMDWQGVSHQPLISQYRSHILRYVLQPSILEGLMKAEHQSRQRMRMLNEVYSTYNYHHLCRQMENKVDKVINLKVGQLKDTQELASLLILFPFQGSSRNKTWSRMMKTMIQEAPQQNKQSLNRQKGAEESEIESSPQINSWDHLFFHQQQHYNSIYNHFVQKVNIITEMAQKTMEELLEEHDVIKQAQLYDWIIKSFLRRLALHLFGQIKHHQILTGGINIKNFSKQIISALLVLVVKELTKASVLLVLKQQVSSVKNVIPRYDHALNAQAKKIIQLITYLEDQLGKEASQMRLDEERVKGGIRNNPSLPQKEYQGTGHKSNVCMRRQSRVFTCAGSKKEGTKSGESITDLSFHSIISSLCQYWDDHYPESQPKQSNLPEASLYHLQAIKGRSRQRLNKKKKNKKHQNNDIVL